MRFSNDVCSLLGALLVSLVACGSSNVCDEYSQICNATGGSGGVGATGSGGTPSEGGKSDQGGSGGGVGRSTRVAPCQLLQR